MTHMCVSATALTALDLGLSATVIADACARRDLPDRSSGILPRRPSTASLLANSRTALPT